ncbi:MAG: hypothetical protein E7228_03790 [Clostridiales bacterium]|nr:hypothetical protein [Clostridiales bacterium]
MIRKKFHRILAVILSIIITMGSMSLNVFAAEMVTIENGYSGTSPEVTVDLVPGKTSSESKEGIKETFIEGDIPENEEDKEYNYTETTVIMDRTVRASAGSIKIDPSASDYEGSGKTPVSIAPDDYDGKRYNDPESNQQTGLIKGYGPDSNIKDAENSGIKRPGEAGYDYLYSGIGDVTNAVKVRNYMVTYARNEDGELIQEEDAEGNPVFNTDGTPKYKMNFRLTGSNADGFDKSTSQFALKNIENGQYYYAYCIDNDTETRAGAWYKVANLEDCDYFPVEESKDHIRAIVNNGYWGTESGTGSVKQIVQAMKTYYGDSEITAVVDDKGGTVTLKVSDIIDGLTESEALAVTQAAIWTYANGSTAVQDGKEGRLIKDIVPVYQPRLDDARPSSRYYRKGTYGSNEVDQETKESNARIQAMYQWLVSLTEEAPDDITAVINDKNFLIEDSMKITVGDKIKEADNGDINNDIYNVDLTFAMVVEPSTDNGDDLIIKLINSDGEVIRQARLAGNEGNDEEGFDELVKNEDNSYTFKDIPMAENSDITFDLKLEGTQYLKKGVYVYSAPNTDETNTFQTLVGIAEGAQRVGVSAEITFSFEVDDSSRYHSETYRGWGNSSDQENPPTPDTKPDTTQGSASDNKSESALEPDIDIIPDLEKAPETVPDLNPAPEFNEDIPVLADVPKTDDNSNTILWVLLMMCIVCGIISVAIIKTTRTE